jgi:hypothetical protein
MTATANMNVANNIKQTAVERWNRYELSPAAGSPQAQSHRK